MGAGYGGCDLGEAFRLGGVAELGDNKGQGNNWYLIVFDWPTDDRSLTVPAATPVKRARLLNGQGEVKVRGAGESGVAVIVPSKKPAEPAAVVVLEFDGEPKAAASAGSGAAR